MIETISNTTSFPIRWKTRPPVIMDEHKLHEGDIIIFPKFKDLQIMMASDKYKLFYVLLNVNGDWKYILLNEFCRRYLEEYSCPLLEKIYNLANHYERLKYLCGKTFKVEAMFPRHVHAYKLTKSGKVKKAFIKKVYMPYLIKI